MKALKAFEGHCQPFRLPCRRSSTGRILHPSAPSKSSPWPCLQQPLLSCLMHKKCWNPSHPSMPSAASLVPSIAGRSNALFLRGRRCLVADLSALYISSSFFFLCWLTSSSRTLN
ncbi:hypothetical protein H112_00934 [Trichophyton rubrum D6]|uniref:Uncharacterized protein n=2 Tax=Trichophyton TaxID=5550 RepID=A0A022WEE2_TRIRU|nr:hypothetical protein H100_00932 [Trichophyton rubrum MR850]EZF46066.1 hypothetical protein H102_00924 [Trichophyton rubrum CBS 100081]EZF56712.1 hypothetical protein H103_00932 [Trichophyton rubrum CBS 288.86]EZF67323.1 hypothetical protein H104_00916 [Trichophyton rubrum CBS 289.86]EZF77981.1 hypothetical protein H105_00931 [Trichophyton soudanense CBS 452.61]EZF88624.1 hypothetical protein H110_00933 [Trichophyton rubrum MR1448]EZF99427.1 hypothetical protein H113_00934 [Trichophyton rub